MPHGLKLKASFSSPRCSTLLLATSYVSLVRYEQESEALEQAKHS
jgi:hypothetical protein